MRLRRLIILLGLFTLIAPARGKAAGHGPITPLEQSGETPVWGENFTDMNVSNMQWAYALPPKWSINNFVIPGAVHLGQIYTSGASEHQLNHFNYTGAEPFAHTVEFDMYQVLPGPGSRIFVRHHWSENGVFIHLDATAGATVVFQDLEGDPQEHYPVVYDTPVGAGQWAHIVVSFLQDFDGDTLETVVAINAEVKQYTMDSLHLLDIERAWTNRREIWSFEFYGENETSGIYLANLRGYAGFMDQATLAARLTPEAVGHYLATLPSPNTDRGIEWLLPRISRYISELTWGEPMAVISTNWTSGLTVQLDAGASQGWRVISGLSWDFENDGVWDVVSGNGIDQRVITHTYPAPGTYQVTLAITTTEYTDSGNVQERLTDTDTVAVTLSGTAGNPSLPTVSITTPVEGAVFEAGADIPLAATASDPDGISKVEFYQGATYLGEDTTAPYGLTWHAAIPWRYTLYAKAFDSRGATAFSDPVYITVTEQADLALTQIGSTAPAIAGAPLTYTLTLTNHGALDATGILLTDTLPDSVTFLSALPAGDCAAAEQVVTCSLGSLAANASTQVSIQVQIAPSAAGALVNAATVNSNEPDLYPLNNTATATLTVSQQADLALALSAAPAPVVAGAPLTYTFTLTNPGPSDAAGIVLTGALPGGVTFLSTTPPDACTETTGMVTCELGDLPAGQSTQVRVQTQVGAGVTDPLYTTAVAVAVTPDPNPLNNTSTVTTSVVQQADLTLALAAIPDPAVAGQTLSYTLTLTNPGPSDASGVVLTDALPGGVTFLSATPADACAETAGNITCTLSDLPAGQSAQVLLEVQVDSATSGTLVNTAHVTAAPTDLNPADNTATTTTSVVQQADLALALTAAPGPAVAGAPLTYTFTLTNLGPSDAPGVALTDTLPPGVTFLSATPTGICSENAGSVTCALGDLPAGQNAQVHIQMVSGIAGVFHHSAWVSSTIFDPDLANNAAAADIPVLNPAGLWLSKSVQAAHDPVRHGDAMTYTLTLANLGDLDVYDVRVSDTLPPYVQGTNLDATLTVTAHRRITFTLYATLSHAAPLQAVIVNTAFFTHTSGNGQASAGLITTPDIIPPAFTILHPVTGSPLITPTLDSNLTTGRPVFDWEDATDNVGVVGYTLLLTGVLDGAEPEFTLTITTTGSVYTPTADLATGSYHWTVCAYDAAGNVSPFVTSPAGFRIIPAFENGGWRIYLPALFKADSAMASLRIAPTGLRLRDDGRIRR